jgi:hypothetical protein
LAVAVAMADAAVPVVAAVPVAAAVPMVAAVVVAAAEAAEVEGAEAAFAADTGMMGSRDQHQLQRYRRLRDESLWGPDDFLESIGQQRAGHVPYGNLSKTAQRNYMASLQDNEEDEAAARAHIYSPGERPFVDKKECDY